MKTRNLSAIICAMALCIAPFAKAADLYWSGNGSTLGGAGTWNTASSTNWGVTGIGPFGNAWTNANNDTALFYGTGVTVTLTDNITVGGLTFNKGNSITTYYTLNANGNTLSFASGDNTLLLTVGNGGASSATITGQVGGSGNVIVSVQSSAAGASSGGMSSGTLTFNGASTGGWSGTTTIGAGITVTLDAANSLNRSLLNTTGITLNGGTISSGVIKNDANGSANRINDAAAITANGGTFQWGSSNAGGTYAETLGSVTLALGQMNFILNGNLSSGLQTLTLGGLIQSGAAAATFANNATALNGPSSGEDRIRVNGITASTPGGQIIGPWATVGASAVAQTDYARYLSDGTYGHVVPATSSLTTTNESGWSLSTTAYQFDAATTLAATRTAAALRYTGAATALGLGASTFNLATYGILNGGSGTLTISTTGTGCLTTPNTGGGTTNNLFLTAGNYAMTVSAPIQDNTSVVTLVKSGGNTLTLSGNNTFSGGLVLNAGTLLLSGTQSFTGGVTLNGGAFGDSTDTISAAELNNNSVTVNGNASMYVTSGETLTSAIAISSTGNLKLSGPTATLGGVVSGSGVLTITSQSSAIVTLTNTVHTHTGVITMVTDNNQNISLVVNSLADSASPGTGNIQMGGGGAMGSYYFTLHSGAIAPLILYNRQVELIGDGPGGTYIVKLSNNSSQALTINSNLRASGSNIKTLTLGGTGTGLSTFAGAIANGGLTTLNLSKADANSTWILSGTNTYSGATTISAGTLILSGINSGSGATTLTAGKLVGVVGGSCSNSAVTVSAGTLGVSVTDTNKQWACGSLTHTAASTLEFAFGANTPSTTVAPLLVNGNVLFAVAPTIIVTNASLSASTYPLLKWTGSFSGVAPSTVTLPSGTGILVFDSANKTIWLSISAAGGSKQPLTWKGPAGSTWVANGTVYTNWQDATTPTPVSTNYQETTVGGITVGDNVVFGNTGAGTVNLDTNVSPAAISVTANTPNNYTISGSGSIAGGGGLTKAGTGSLKLSTANSYSGGTLLSAGTLIIDNASALGTGPLVLAGGTLQNIDATPRILDNTVVLNGTSTIGGTGSLTFSNPGAGAVTATSTITNNVNVTFATALSGSGSITKVGAGTMTLTGTNTYSGGMTVNGGSLVVNGGQNIGGGAITIGNATHLNTMIVTNANILSGTITVGNGSANSNTMTIVNAMVNATNSALRIGYVTSNAILQRNNNVTVGNQGTLLVGAGGITVGYDSPGTGGTGTLTSDSLIITNGGYVASSGTLKLGDTGYTSGVVSGLVVVANGGQLFTAGATISANYNNTTYSSVQVIGGGSGGPTSTWNMGNAALTVAGPAAGSYNFVMIDGAGVAGGAVLTNANTVTLSGAANGLVLTNGARWFSSGTITLGNGNSHTLTIVGGSADSVFSGGGGGVSVGAGSISSLLAIGIGGSLTNIGTVYVGQNVSDTLAAGNRLAVIGNSARLSSAGDLVVGQNMLPNNGSAKGATNNAVVIGDGAVVQFSGGLTVGSPGYGNNTAPNSFNSVTVTNGGQFYTGGAINYIGRSQGATYLQNARSNQATIVGNNSLWDLGNKALLVGYGARADFNVLNVSSGGIATNISALIVAATNTLSLGAGGQIYANAVTNAGIMAVGLDTTLTPACGCLNVTSNLNVNAASLDIITTGKPVGVFVIASYGALVSPGVFAATNGLPENCKLYMNYNNQKQIAIVGLRNGTVIHFR